MIWHRVSREKFFGFLELIWPVQPVAMAGEPEALEFYLPGGRLAARFRPGRMEDRWQARYEIRQDDNAMPPPDAR